jgi:PAS domain S-box-containing protein
VWEGDAQTGLFTFVSPAAERILGYPTDSWLIEPTFWIDRLHPDDREWVVDYCASATAALRPHECEYRMLAADGRSVWLRETVTVTAENQRPKLLRGMLIDITERKQVDEALRERELQYRSVFESSLDGMFINNLSGQLVDFNPAAAHMHGYTVDEFRQIQPPQFIHPDSHHLFAAYMETVKACREYRCRAVDVRKDGSTFYAEVVGTPFTLRGQPHAFAIVRDISAQVEAERLLEQRVMERTRELSTLLDVSRNVASTLEIEPLLGLILDALKVFVDYTGARIYTLEGQTLRVRAARGHNRADRPIGAEFALSGRVAEEVLLHRRVLVIPDLDARADPWAVAFRAEGPANIEAILTRIRSWMGVPLIARGRVIGNLSLEHDQPGFYNAHQPESFWRWRSGGRGVGECAPVHRSAR